MELFWFLIFSLLGFTLAKLLSGRKEGCPGILPSVKFKIDQYLFHIHHWVWSGLIIFIMLLIGSRNIVIYGLLAGIFFQGLTYRDFYKIISRL